VKPAAEEAPRRPRLGFLGIGWIGRHRLESVQASGLGEVIALADESSEALLAAATVAPGAAVVPSLGALLEQDLDGVVIATPSALHAEQALAAIEHGLAVFCQKPLGRDGAETARVVRAAEGRDVLLGVDLSYRWTAAGRAVREIVRSGELGDIYAVNLVFHNAYGPDKAWFYDRRLAGGGCLVDLGIHLVDLALWCLGGPGVRTLAAQLFSGGRPLGRGDIVEDFATAQLELDGGASVQLACSWRLPAGRDAIIEASFFGSHGGVTLRNVNGSFYDFVAERTSGTHGEVVARPPDAWGGRAAVDWLGKLAGGGRFDPEAHRHEDVARVLDAIYDCAGRRRPG
jgi:predicted dehydrogenase